MGTPSPQLPVEEPLTGFVGDAGGHVASKAGIFRASTQRISGDFILWLLAAGSAAIVLLMLAALIFVLFKSSIPSMKQFGLGFFASSTWQPNETVETVRKKDANGNLIIKGMEHDEFAGTDTPIYDETRTVHPVTFGAAPAIYGTVVSSALALVIAVPLSFGAALFLVRIGTWLSPTFVKCGLAGLFVTMLLGGVLSGSTGLMILGVVVGIAITGALLFVSWQLEDPRVGARPAMEACIFAVIALAVFLLSRFVFEGTAIVSILSGVIAALLIHLLASSFVGIVSFLIEFLAAIPSIAYGIWGTLVLAPFLRDHVEPGLNNVFNHVPFLHFLASDSSNGHNMLSGAMILAIMILPIITAISRDVLKAVPRIQIEGTQALGATWWQSSWAMLRYGRSGLFGAVILGLARAAGETMAILMVMPPEMRISLSVLQPVATMSALIASQFPDANIDLQRSALTEIALLLLLMSLTFNIAARYFVVGAKRTVA